MSPRTLLALFMPVFYSGAGAVLLFTDAMADTVGVYRRALGGVLLGYGLLRAILVWRSYRRKQVAPNATDQA
jgi:hypothetical protein